MTRVIVDGLAAERVQPLIAQLSRAQCQLGIVGDQHAALAGRDRLVRIKGETGKVAVATDRPLRVGCAGRFAGILDQPQVMSAGQGLQRLPSALRQREAIAALYHARLSADPRFELPAPAEAGQRLAWFTWPLRLAPELHHRRDALIQSLRAAGIGCNTYFTPVHQLPYHRGRHRQVALPVSEDIGRRCLAVPLYGQMGAAEVDRVCEVLDRLLP